MENTSGKGGWWVARGNTKSGSDANFANNRELLTLKLQTRMNRDSAGDEQEATERTEDTDDANAELGVRSAE